MEEKEEKKEKELNIEELQQKLEECQKLKEEYLAGWQRARADLLNYKKEEIERVGELIKYADVGIALEILPILDNFEIALKEIQNHPKQNEFTTAQIKPESQNSQEIIKGFLQIKNQISEFLKNQGIEEIKSAGEKFDPNFHEVVEEVPFDAAQGQKSGVIFEEIQKGYTINGRMLRPAKVKVVK